eukprot:jgi/Mesvir1/9877/Mv22408-RA.1
MLLFSVIIVFVGFLLPVSVAWDSLLGWPWDLAFFLSDVFFMIDTCLNFRLGYIVKADSVVAHSGFSVAEYGSAVVEMDPKKVALHYLRTWFAIDFVSSLPLDDLSWVMDSRGKRKRLRLLVLLRLLKLVRFARLGRFTRWKLSAAKLEAKEYIIAFFWPYNPEGAWVYSTTVQVEDQVVPLMEADWWAQYVACVYFAFVSVASIGYGDIHPGNTNPERIWGAFQAAIGAFVLGYIVAKITSLMLDRHERNRRVEVRARALAEFLEQHEFDMPDWMKARIVQCFDRKFRATAQEALKAEIMDAMPPYDIGPVEPIFTQGSRSGTLHLYVILSGIVMCSKEPKPPSSTVEEGLRDHPLDAHAAMFGRSSGAASRRWSPHRSFSVPLEIGHEAQDAQGTSASSAGSERDVSSSYETSRDSSGDQVDRPAGLELEPSEATRSDGMSPSAQPRLSRVRAFRPFRHSKSRAASTLQDAGKMDQAQLTAGSLLGTRLASEYTGAGRAGSVPHVNGQVATGSASVSSQNECPMSSVTSQQAAATQSTTSSREPPIGEEAPQVEEDSLVETWELGAGATLGEANLEAVIRRLDHGHPLARQLRAWAFKQRPLALYSAESRTHVALEVISFEDMLQAMEGFPLMFKPVFREMRHKDGKDRRGP